MLLTWKFNFFCRTTDHNLKNFGVFDCLCMLLAVDCRDSRKYLEISLYNASINQSINSTFGAVGFACASLLLSELNQHTAYQFCGSGMIYSGSGYEFIEIRILPMLFKHICPFLFHTTDSYSPDSTGLKLEINS